MEPTNVSMGITLGIVAGILLGSFALPMKKVKTWQWEHTWVMFSLWATIVLPLIWAIITVPNIFSVFVQTPIAVIAVVFLFGAGWGVANVTYGMGLKIVGLAMGTAIVLGLNNAIGAILPVILYSPEKLFQPSGLTLSFAVLIMIAGIVVCAIAGLKREKALSNDSATDTKKSNNSLFIKGFIICIVSGIFGGMFNFALINGKPIEIIAIELGTSPLNAANPTWVIALAGGFVVTLIYCIYLFKINRNVSVFFSKGTGINWLFTFIMGAMWYGGVAFYGMSVSNLGVLGASIGFAIIQSMAVGSGNFWGMVTGEWKGSGITPVRYMIGGLSLLFVGIVIVGFAATLN